jgi:nicotinate-nucleotide pyrophosphorylase (carboxylating)
MTDPKPIDYQPVVPDGRLEHAVRSLIRLAIDEDLADAVDWTTVCLIEPERKGGCQIVAREPGVCAGLAMLPWILDEFDADLQGDCLIEDGSSFQAGQPIARVRGNVRDLLTSERTVLNVISRLCGVATLTRRFVAQLVGTRAKLYDTRKTTPGWRLMEKYAVRCGGGCNHRSGLYDGFLIKDNHLALAGDASAPFPAGEAAAKAILWRGAQVDRLTAPRIVEVEVDSLDQLRDVLPKRPDIVLLDNFSLDKLREAVGLRDALAAEVQLEASGNVKIDTIARIAATGVERISSGALTHQATSLDLGLDWFDSSAS